MCNARAFRGLLRGTANGLGLALGCGRLAGFNEVFEGDELEVHGADLDDFGSNSDTVAVGGVGVAIFDGEDGADFGFAIGTRLDDGVGGARMVNEAVDGDDLASSAAVLDVFGERLHGVEVAVADSSGRGGGGELGGGDRGGVGGGVGGVGATCWVAWGAGAFVIIDNDHGDNRDDSDDGDCRDDADEGFVGWFC